MATKRSKEEEAFERLYSAASALSGELSAPRPAPFGEEVVRGFLLEAPSGDRGVVGTILDVPWLLGATVGFIPHFRIVSGISRIGRSIRLLRVLSQSPVAKQATAIALQKTTGGLLRGKPPTEALLEGGIEGVIQTGIGGAAGFLGRRFLSPFIEETRRALLGRIPPAARRAVVAPLAPAGRKPAPAPAPASAVPAPAAPAPAPASAVPAPAAPAPAPAPAPEVGVPPVAPAAKSATVPSISDLPPPKKGMLRFFHGRGGPAGAGLSEDWWTTNPARARSFGPEVRYVDVPQKEGMKFMQAAREAGSGTAGDAILPEEYIGRASPVEIEPKTYVLEASSKILREWIDSLKKQAKRRPAELAKLEEAKQLTERGKFIEAVQRLTEVQETLRSSGEILPAPSPAKVPPAKPIEVPERKVPKKSSSKAPSPAKAPPAKPTEVPERRVPKKSPSKGPSRGRARLAPEMPRESRRAILPEGIDASVSGKKLRLPEGDVVEAVGIMKTKDFGDVVVYKDPSGEFMIELLGNIKWL